MRRFRAWFALALAITFWPGVACTGGGPIDLDAVNETRANEVRELISKELAQGASSEAIEQFFDRHEITHSFNRFANRYQAIIRDVATGPGVDQAIVIHVHVDEERRFLGAEVRNSFTAP